MGNRLSKIDPSAMTTSHKQHNSSGIKAPRSHKQRVEEDFTIKYWKPIWGKPYLKQPSDCNILEECRKI
ncbi:hypothetical protein Trydic_g906 [Trypoxylus dichotomus]